MYLKFYTMKEKSKREYLTPQIRQMLVVVEDGYAISHQDTSGTTTDPSSGFHFGTIPGQW